MNKLHSISITDESPKRLHKLMKPFNHVAAKILNVVFFTNYLPKWVYFEIIYSVSLFFYYKTSSRRTRPCKADTWQTWGMPCVQARRDAPYIQTRRVVLGTQVRRVTLGTQARPSWITLYLIFFCILYIIFI